MHQHLVTHAEQAVDVRDRRVEHGALGGRAAGRQDRKPHEHAALLWSVAFEHVDDPHGQRCLSGVLLVADEQVVDDLAHHRIKPATGLEPT
jgi:hypothetical protein